LAIAAGIVSGACNTLLLALINSRLGGEATPGRGLVFAGLCVLLPATRFASEGLLAYLGQSALLDFRLNVSRKIVANSLRRIEELGAHRLMTMFTDDLPVITNAVTLIPLVAINAAVLTGALIYLAMLSTPVLFGVICFILLGALVYQIPVARALRFLRGGREDADLLVKHFRAITRGTKELKLHRPRREAFFDKVFRPAAVSYGKQNVRGLMIYSAASSCGQALVFALIGLTLFLLPRFEEVSLHALTAYTLIFLYLAAPIQSLMNQLPALGRAEVAMRKVDDLGVTLVADGVEAASLAPAGAEAAWRSLELEGVSLGYRGEDDFEGFYVGPIDLSIHPGEIVFFAGGNGSGKTTLAKIITGLYKPERGVLRLNGRVVTDEDADNYRQNFSAVFSDFFLFETLLGFEFDDLDARARELLFKLQLDRKVKVKDATLSTISLSTGQQKRLALLTACLDDRPVFVFDEWAADQDPFFREIFYEEILPTLRAQGKAVIAITHDEEYYHVADRLIRMVDGKIDFDRTLSDEYLSA
jgi:putative ATP-binding cassette transporter